MPPRTGSRRCVAPERCGAGEPAVAARERRHRRFSTPGPWARRRPTVPPRGGRSQRGDSSLSRRSRVFTLIPWSLRRHSSRTRPTPSCWERRSCTPCGWTSSERCRRRISKGSSTPTLRPTSKKAPVRSRNRAGAPLESGLRSLALPHADRAMIPAPQAGPACGAINRRLQSAIGHH